MDENELAALQAALIHTLRQASTADEARELLLAAPLSDAAQRWIADSDSRSLETAIALVRRWSR